MKIIYESPPVNDKIGYYRYGLEAAAAAYEKIKDDDVFFVGYRDHKMVVYGDAETEELTLCEIDDDMEVETFIDTLKELYVDWLEYRLNEE